MEMTPWFKHYDEGVPRTLRPYERTRWTILLIQQERSLIIQHYCSKGCVLPTVNWKGLATPLQWPSLDWV
jgi:hypothetical protein